MSQSENGDRPWHEETTKILQEIDLLMWAEASHYAEHKADIAELRTDLRVHKIKTGWVAATVTAITIAAAWMLSMFRGGG